MPDKLPRTTVEQWALLAAIVDRGGYAQAAEALHRSQSTVSYTVAKLQELLALPLLEIRGRKAELNEHGTVLLARARRIVDELNSLEQLARSLQSGWESELHLVVDAAFPRAQLLAILEELQKACANTRLQLDDAVLSGAEQALTEGRADVAIAPSVPGSMLGDWLMDVTFIAVASPRHPLFALGRELTLDDLTRHTQAVVRDSGTQRPRDAGWLGSPLRWTVSAVEASLAAVEAGLAFAWLPDHLVEPRIAAGTLAALPLVAGRCRRVPLYVILAQPDSAGPAARLAAELFLRHRKEIPNFTA
jgi:DNA-binding transcriptional LysR family regulator